MNEDLAEFLAYISTQRRYSAYTSRNYEGAVNEWLSFLAGLGLDAKAATRRDARRFLMHISDDYQPATIRNKISAVRSFYKFLLKTFSVEADPFDGLKLPKKPRNLPVFLTETQMPQLLEAPFEDERANGLDHVKALRDALCFELLYGAGLRVSELCSLKWRDIDFLRNAATVRGKGNKTRFCPFGKVAGNLLRTWRDSFSPFKNPDDFILYTPRNKPMYPRFVQRELAKYLAQTNLPSNITPHKLRHSFATHLVNEGVDLRALQEMLGHASLSTTQIYTHLNTKKLVAEHRSSHPKA